MGWLASLETQQSRLIGTCLLLFPPSTRRKLNTALHDRSTLGHSSARPKARTVANGWCQCSMNERCLWAQAARCLAKRCLRLALLEFPTLTIRVAAQLVLCVGNTQALRLALLEIPTLTIRVAAQLVLCVGNTGLLCALEPMLYNAAQVLGHIP